MLDGLYNRPYDIIEKQKRYQNDPRPLHWRAPRRGIYLRLFGVAWAAGAVGTVAGLYTLVKGK
ncbi:hypothetical protein L218DRAFT_996967 [Marasmius fiardii PR-910]|nr:hypothetical protein L218DRAFT_996967 [Marasmius fiardii PR-910]